MNRLKAAVRIMILSVFLGLFMTPSLCARAEQEYVRPINGTVNYYMYVQGKYLSSQGLLDENQSYYVYDTVSIGGSNYYEIEVNQGRYYVKCSNMRRDDSDDQTAEIPILSVDKNQVMTHENYTLRYSAPNADDIQLRYIWAGQDYIYYQHVNSETLPSMQSPNEAEYIYYISALYGNSWINSNQVNVKIVAPYGAVENPEIKAPFRIDKGDMLNFSIIAPLHAAFQYAMITNPAGQTMEILAEYSKEQEDYAVDTKDWPEGKYHINVSYESDPGYTGACYAIRSFYIGDVDMTVSLTAEKAKILTGTELTLHCSAPNADEVWLYKKENEFNGRVQSSYWYQGIEGEDYIDHWLDTPKTITYWLEARFGDEIVSSELVEISVLVPYGRLQTPVIHIPYRIPQGEQICFTVDPIPFADIYYISIRDNQGELYYHSFDAAQAYSGEMENIVLSPERDIDGTCVVFIQARGKGATENYLEAYFHVGDVDEQTKISINRDRVLAHEEVTITFSAPHADRYQIYEKIGNDETLCSYGVGGLEWEYPRAWDEPETVTYTLKALYGNIWREASANLQIESNGQLELPKVTVSYQVQYGQPVTFNVERVNHAEDYKIWVWKKSENGMGTVDFYQQPGSYTLENLKEGAYYIEAAATAEGWREATYIGYFHVGEIDKTADIYIKNQTIQVQEEFYLYYLVKEADIFRIINKETGKIIIEDKYTSAYEKGVILQEEIPGSITYVLEAEFGPEIIRKEITAFISGGDEQLAAPTLNAPEWMESGKDVTVSIEPVHHAERYLFEAYAGDVLCEGGYTEEPEFMLWTDFLPFHGVLRVEVKASAAGYLNSEPAIVYIRIGNEIVPPILDTLQIMVLPVDLCHIKEQAFEAIGAERIVLPDQIKRIESYAFANCANLQYINLPDSLTDIADDAFDGCDQLFIECSAGSVGERFAKAHGFYTVIK